MAPQSIWPRVFRSGKRASRSRRAVVLGFAGADLGVQARLLSKGAADLLALVEKLGRRIDSHGEALQQNEALTLWGGPGGLDSSRGRLKCIPLVVIPPLPLQIRWR